MPLKKLVFKPGVNRENTSYANEGGWFASDKIRFRSGQAEKIGGWVRDAGTIAQENAGVAATLPTPPTGSIWGVARGMWNWITLVGYNLLAIGTNLKYYIQNGAGGQFFDITPIRDTNIAVPNAFTTTTGSTTVVVNDPSHGANTGDFVTITATSGPVNGIPALVMNGEYEVEVLTTNTYSIVVSLAASSPGTPAVSATFEYQLNGGNAIYTSGVGWGAGVWGGVVLGAPASTLNGAINSSVTSIVLTSSAAFGSTGTVVIDSEAITYTGNAANTLTGCVRGSVGSIAAAHLNGATVQKSNTFTGWGLASASGVSTNAQMRVWSQINFGERLVFNPRGSGIYLWVPDTNPAVFNRGQLLSPSNTNAQNGQQYWLADASCPSACNHVIVSDASRFVIAFGCNDPTGVYASTSLDPMQIRWSDQESCTVWTPAITNQAGDFRVSRGSAIITAVQTRQEILVFTDAALYSMQYLGAPYVWGVQIMGDNISIAGPNAAVTANNLTYWMGQDKFYVYSGRVQTLPSTLREYVYTDINLTQAFQITAGTNEGYNEIWWQYCSATSNVVDRYVIYNHLEEVWYYGTWDNVNGLPQGRTAWSDSPLRGSPMAMTYGVAGGDANATLVYHESGTDDSAGVTPLAISASVTSSDFDIDDGHNYGFVWRSIPDLTFDGSNVANPTCTLSIYPRDFPGTPYRPVSSEGLTSAQNYQTVRTYAVQQFTPEVYTRLRGRQLSFQISSNTLGVQWQMGNMRIDLRQDGRKV
jgi:hypothetical protein